MISEEVIQKVREQTDIVDVISEKVRLKKSGRNFIGNCPFHSEKTPSFTVSQDKQIYKCFGCGEAGNVFSFIMKTENKSFPESVKALAEKVGIEVEEKNNINRAKKDKFEKMKKLNVDAAKYFYANLRRNKEAFQYLKNRSMYDRTMTKFGIGFAVDKWQALRDYLRGKGYSDKEMLELGLIVKGKNNNCYDRFRNRIIFPVFDYKGTVIGFGGRVLDDSKPKYLNSPETPLFLKGTNLYGLNFAIKQNMNRTVIIVEGYMDCIALHQQGITNVVATLGTALTERQAKLLKRYADRAIISYDADLAGQKATLRGLDILRKSGFDVRVLSVPSGKDPDEFIKTYGKEAFQALIDKAMPLIDYKIKKVEEGINFTDNEMIIRYKNKVLEIIKDLSDFEKNIYIKQVAEKLKVKEELLSDEFNQKIKQNENNYNIQQDYGQNLYIEPAHIKAERILLKFMLTDTEKFDFISYELKDCGFISHSHKKLHELILKFNDLPYEEKLKSIENNCNDSETTKQFINLMEYEISGDKYDLEKMIHDCIKMIKKYRLEESEKEIMNKIKQYESKGLVEKSLKCTQELINIQKALKNI
ncbi:MAG: DNA primase [Clostridium argentinense]|nr:DNA primase [Clostridium argentinense]